MVRKISLFLFIILFGHLSAMAQGQADRQQIIHEGTGLSSVRGKIHVPAENELSFELLEDVNTPLQEIKAGRVIKFMPSSLLEKIEHYYKKRNTREIKLWGKVTKFRGENFIFPVYFLTLKQQQDEGEADEQEPLAIPEPNEPRDAEKDPGFNDPNDILSVPKDLLAKIEKRPVVEPEKLDDEDIKLEDDHVFTGRTGYIKERIGGYYIFEADSLGMNISDLRLYLLPSLALEKAAAIQARNLSEVMFETSGIVTEYKGKRYLLLQRAARKFNYGNFGI